MQDSVVVVMTQIPSPDEPVGCKELFVVLRPIEISHHVLVASGVDLAHLIGTENLLGLGIHNFHLCTGCRHTKVLGSETYGHDVWN